jgi:hypothetical protein
MRYQLLADDGTVKKTLNLPPEILPIKRANKIVKKYKSKRKRRRVDSAKALVNGYNCYKRRSKTK